MNAIQQLLTEHMAIWTAADTEKKSGRGRASGNAGSVYGIKKLRELILELAVRGKLVPQDPNDEPASELLKHIQAEKTKLVSERKIKKDKPLVAIADEDKLFELPHGWEWIRNNQLFQLRKGRIPKTLNESGLGLPYLDIDALDRNIMRRYSEDLTCPQSTDKDILVVCDGSRSGLVLDGKNGIIGSTLSIIDTPFFIQNYIKLIFKQGFEIFNTSMKGAAIPHLDTQKLLQNPTALPPLSEQHRIVTKVDELMALCDQLEAQHSNAEEAHEKLISHLLGTLTQSQSADDFSANWQRIAAHFDTLFTTETSIDELKQTLLQLAVMGKLVPQDANDEPASDLLKRIQTEKAKLIAEGKLKKEKPLAPIGDEEKPFELPQEWEWIRLGTIGDWGAGATPLRSVSSYYGGDMPWFKSGELSSDFIDVAEETITEQALKECSLRLNQPGDVLIAMYGATIGKASILKIPATTNQAVCACTPNSSIFNRYLLVLLKAMKSNFIGQGAGGAQPNISREKIIATIAALPPLAEQHRIVAKVDELMMLCDQLKTRIQQANQQQQKLADVLVDQSVVE